MLPTWVPVEQILYRNCKPLAIQLQGSHTIKHLRPPFPGDIALPARQKARHRMPRKVVNPAFIFDCHKVSFSRSKEGSRLTLSHDGVDPAAGRGHE